MPGWAREAHNLDTARFNSGLRYHQNENTKNTTTMMRLQTKETRRSPRALAAWQGISVFSTSECIKATGLDCGRLSYTVILPAQHNPVEAPS